MAGGDTVEFQQLFEPLYRQCHALAKRLLGSDARAETAATEALVCCYARWSRVRSLPHPEGWALRTTVGLVSESIREDSRGVDDLGLAVAALPGRTRDAVALRYLTSLTDDEVGLALGMTPESVRAAVREGLADLRARMGIGGTGVSAA
jgi:DNA-directed RNA polymerase specialized sigma24 family protein